MATGNVQDVDVLIAGSGPIGCAFARELAIGGRDVLLLEAGVQHSPRPGAHLKNAVVFQRNLDHFTPIVLGMLHPLSVPPATGGGSTLDPIAFTLNRTASRSAMNPEQDPARNMPGAAVSYGVGGMFSHWTSNTPRFHPRVERSTLLTEQEWDELYDHAEDLVETHTDIYSSSVRHRAIRRQLEHHYGEALAGTRGVTELPVAGVRQQDNDEFVHFSGADTILGPLIDAPESVAGHFELRPEHRVSELTHDHGRVTEAHVTDLRSGRGYRVRARTYIVACGLLTAQLLWKSGIRPSALGRHLMEHPIAFAQVVLSRDLVEEIRSERIPPRVAQWGSESRTIRSEPDDPVPVPMSDPPPMLCIPVSERRRWHCQIHRDSFSYGAVPDDIDDRLIVDLRWFGMVDPNPDNRVTFDDRRNDVLGMPKARFDYQLHDDDRTRAHAMMGDLLFAAQGLGGFLPTAQPQFMPAGTSLHFTGVYRMGAVDDGSSVVDSYSRVWGFDNLVLGGNGVIPDANASNPTLTSIALATRAARKILES